MDKRLGFDAVPEIYDRVRPRYPDDLFDHLFALLPERPEIIEVGPGTGQATRALLARGARVHAIELGPNLATRLRENLPSADLRISVGDFERIPNESSIADALVSATAYHWIPSPANVDRPAALLLPGGAVAIVDTVQITSEADQGFFEACQPIYERYGEGHTGPPAPTEDRVDPPMRAALDADARFVDADLRTYRWDQAYSAAAYRDLMLSYSGTQAMTEPARSGLLDDMERFITAEFDGEITRPLVVALTTARRR